MSDPQPASAADVPPRRAQLAANLAAVERRLVAACAEAGRARGEVTLVAVTKTFPADDVEQLVALGLRDFGENRDQEARGKAQALAAAHPADPADPPAGQGPVRWHFVGRLQRNKCRSVASYADVVHSIDRVPLAQALAGAAEHAGRTLDALVQVSLDADPGRGGALPGDVPAVAAAIAAASRLRLVGVMAVAPMDADPDEAFAVLGSVSRALRAEHPDATWISAGMSGDLEAAIRHGATHVRVGTALLGGRRPPLR